MRIGRGEGGSESHAMLIDAVQCEKHQLSFTSRRNGVDRISMSCQPIWPHEIVFAVAKCRKYVS